jgi:hypothetical protein
MISKKTTIVIATALVLLGSILPGCRRTPDEARVREAIAAMAQAAEAGSAGDVGKPLSEDFDGNGGRLDRRGLTGMIRLLALRGDHVGVTMGPVSIERRGERMVATFTATLRSGGKLLPDQLGVYRVESAWRNEDGDWRCYTATWERVM